MDDKARKMDDKARKEWWINAAKAWLAHPNVDHEFLHSAAIALKMTDPELSSQCSEEATYRRKKRQSRKR